jgi:RNA polymerase sigma factor (sigma-70 family)
MSDTDMELLARYTRQHAEDAFAELVRRHVGLIYSAALRQVRSPQLAEEVSQSVFIDLACQAARLKPDTILTAWLYQVTRRSAIDVVRREASRQLREQIATEMNAMNATAADWTHIEPLLDEAMHALDDTDRTAVLLRYFENKSLREVGTTLGTSENAAQKRLGRAVERLREFFTKRGVTVGASGLVVVISANAVQAAPMGLAGTVTAASVATGDAVTISSAPILAKLMASTKLKLSIAACVTGLLALLVIFMWPTSPLPDRSGATERKAQPRDFVGTWSGQWDRTWPVYFTISHDARSGEFTVVYDWQETLGRPLKQRLYSAETNTLVDDTLWVGPRIEFTLSATNPNQARAVGNFRPRRTADLIRLPADSQELAQLRTSLEAKPAATAPAAPSGTAPNLVTAAAWANVGQDTPEAAIQTLFWASKQGETNLIANLLRVQRDAEIPATEQLDQKLGVGLVAGATQYFASLQGFRVTSRQKEREDEARVEVELTNKDGKTEAHTLRLLRDGDQWFPVMHVWLQDKQDKGSVRAALDMPPKFQQPK